MEDTRKKYGKGARAYAMILLERGVSYQDVSNETGIKVTTLRAYRCNSAKEKSNAGKNENNVATQKSNAVAMIEIENIAMMQSKEQPALNVDTMQVMKKNAAFSVTGYEVVYYIIQAITCVGVVTALGWVGVGVAVVYFGIATSALIVAKKENASGSSDVSMTGVILVELFVGLICHIVWANEAIWANLDRIPVKVKWVEWNEKGSGEFWVNGDIPFMIACYIAVFMVVSACFCVYATIKMAKLKVKNESSIQNKAG